MKKLILGILYFLTSLNLFANPEDHGKDYMQRDNNGGVPIWFILLLFGIIAIIIKILSDFGSARKTTRIEQKTKLVNQPYSPNNLYIRNCPTCLGHGWIKGPEVYSNVTEKCSICNGYGKLLNEGQKAEVERRKAADRARRLAYEEELSDFKKEQTKKRNKTQSKCMSKGIPFFSKEEFFEELSKISQQSRSIVHRIVVELENCEPCRTCNGDRSCPYCHGEKKIFNEKASELYNELQNLESYRRSLNDDYSFYTAQRPFDIQTYRGVLHLFNIAENHDIENVTKCDNCDGLGYIRKFEVIEELGHKYKKIICTTCGGKCYVNSS